MHRVLISNVRVKNLAPPGEPWRAPLQTDWYRGIALSGFNPAPLSIIQLGGVVRLEGRSRTKRPRRAGAQGGLGADADLLSQIFGAKTQIIGSH